MMNMKLLSVITPPYIYHNASDIICFPCGCLHCNHSLTKPYMLYFIQFNLGQLEKRYVMILMRFLVGL